MWTGCFSYLSSNCYSFLILQFTPGGCGDPTHMLGNPLSTEVQPQPVVLFIWRQGLAVLLGLSLALSWSLSRLVSMLSR